MKLARIKKDLSQKELGNIEVNPFMVTLKKD